MHGKDDRPGPTKTHANLGQWLAFLVLFQSQTAAYGAPVSEPVKPEPKPGPILLKQPEATTREPTFFTIATGSPAGTYFAVGEALAAVISHPKGSERCAEESRCGPEGMLAVAKTSDGSITNIAAVNAGNVASGLAQADLADAAYRGVSPFGTSEPLTSLRTIGYLYPETVHIVAAKPAEIGTASELRGRRVSIDRPGSGTRSVALKILTTSGLSQQDVVTVEASTLEAIDLVTAGELDALFFVGGAPVPILFDLMESGTYSLVQLDAAQIESLQTQSAFFNEASIPAATYGLPNDTKTVSVGALWLVNAEVSSERVYAITKALWHEENRETLVAGHDQDEFMSQDSALTELPVPLHPGAEAYYREIGLLGDPGEATGGVQSEAALSPDAPTN